MMESPGPAAAGGRQPLTTPLPAGGALIDRSNSCDPEYQLAGAGAGIKQQQPLSSRSYLQNHLQAAQHSSVQ